MALTRATDKIIGDSNGNLNLSGIVTATRFSGPLVPSGDLNVGNNIKLGTASGIITATNVSIADSIVHTGDTNTSLRFPAVDTITAETAGVERLRIFSDGKFGFGTDSLSEQTMAEFSSSVGGGAIGANITIRNSSTNSVNNVAELRLKTAHGVARFFKYNTGETYLSSHVGGASDLVLEANGAKSFRVNTNSLERLRIDLSGRFLVGTTSYKSNLNASTDVQIGQFVGKNDNENACLSVFSYPGTTNPTARGAKLQLHRARSTDGTTNTAVAQNDLIGSIEFKGNDGTNFTKAASIDVNVDGAPGTDDMPGRLVFSTSADGSGVPTERMRISKEGKLTFSTPSGDDAFLVKGDSFTAVRIQAARNDPSDKAMFQMLGSRGTNASPAILQSGDTMGTLSARGWDGNSFAQSSEIRFSVSTTPGDGDMPGKIEFATASDGSAATGVRMTIDHNGYVTKPETPFFAVHGSASNQTYNQDTDLTFENSSQNVGGHFKTTSGTGQYERFIAPIAGVYMFTMGFFPNSASNCRISLAVNGNVQTNPYISGCFTAWGTGQPVPMGSQMLKLSANDYVTVRITHGTLSNTYDGHTGFQGFLLG